MSYYTGFAVKGSARFDLGTMPSAHAETALAEAYEKARAVLGQQVDGYSVGVTLTEGKPFDLGSALIEYEQGSLDEEDTVALFQRLLDTGMLNHLQGHYGRTAASLIDRGLITPKES